MLFYFMLCYAFQCYSIVLFAIPFYAMFFYSVVFHALLFYAILLYCIVCNSILCCFILFYAMLFYCFLCSSVVFYATLFYYLLFFDMQFYVFLFYDLVLHSLQQNFNPKLMLYDSTPSPLEQSSSNFLNPPFSSFNLWTQPPLPISNPTLFFPLFLFSPFNLNYYKSTPRVSEQSHLSDTRGLQLSSVFLAAGQG